MLQRVGRAPNRITFAGTYRGKGMTVSIRNIRLLDRDFDTPDEKGVRAIIGETYEVEVTVRLGATTDRIRGTFSHGP